jgi:NAD(P)H-hydrate epimerase
VNFNNWLSFVPSGKSRCYHEKMNKPFLNDLKPLFDRPPSAHKYDFGHVLVVGGAPGMVGAPFLAARAALRTGAGLVTIASTQGIIDKLEKRVEEVMTLRVAGDATQALGTLTDFIATRKVSVLAIGPGLDQGQAGLVKALLNTVRLPVILDAGGLAAYSGDLANLGDAGKRNPDIILSPHRGEFARLIGRQLPEVEAEVPSTVVDTARATATTIILKGHSTFVAAADDKTYVNDSGNPGLATAGTGDVLTGIIAGLRAQHLNSFTAACAAVYVHGLAGDLAAAVKTQAGLIASDVIEFIPAALHQIKQELSGNKHEQ